MQRNTRQFNNQGFYIQNILAGPLVICDPPHIKNGLYLDPLQPGEVVSLSYYEPETLGHSLALNNALVKGYAISLTEEEYYEQIAIAEQRQIEQNQEMKRKIVESEAAGNIFEAEQINLASAGNPHGDYSTEALLAQKNGMHDQKAWRDKYQEAKAQGLVRDPLEFKELIESGKLAIQSGYRGKRVSLTEMQNIGAQDQINMTTTKATIAMPGSYQDVNNSMEREERGGVYTEKRQLTNFNSTGSLVGSTAGIVDSPTPSYSTHPNMQKQASDEEIENVDINQEDDEYEQQYRTKSQQIAERLTPKSPYLGQKFNKR